MVNHGAGRAGRNTVVSIMIQIQGSVYQLRKIIMMRLAVNRKMVSSRKTIVVVVTQDIVHQDGNNYMSQK